MWADLYRSAAGTAGGSGLPCLTPADANGAAVWSMKGTNTGTLPGYGTIAANQMPGYILPIGGSINITGPGADEQFGQPAVLRKLADYQRHVAGFQRRGDGRRG